MTSGTLRNAGVLSLSLLSACGDAPACAVDAAPPDAAVYAPVPADAQGVPIDPAVGYAVQAVRDGLYYITNGSDQAMFLVSSAGVLLADAPESLAAAIVPAVRTVTAQPITHVVYSHHHADHIGAAGQVAPGAQFIAHAATARLLTRAADARRPVPAVTFEDRYTLTVGDQRLELSYAGSNHTDGNIFIFAPRQRTLMAVDLVWPGWVPFYEFGQAKDLPGYRAALGQVLGFDFDTYIGGHLGRAGRRSDVEATQRYVDDVFTEAAAALTGISIFDVAREVGFGNPFVLVNTWFGRMDGLCASRVSPRWVGKLGAADVWPRSHCLSAIQSLRID